MFKFISIISNKLKVRIILEILYRLQVKEIV